MATRLSRRKIAAFYADELLAGRDIRAQLAAYLVETRRTREYELLARDIEAALADRGVLVADIASSATLSSESRKAVETYLMDTTSAKQIYMRELIDATLLGGVKAAIPGRELDATLRHKLNQLKASKM